jgi:hypothetical protein
MTVPALSAPPDPEAGDWRPEFADALRLDMRLIARKPSAAAWQPSVVYVGGTPGTLWFLADLVDEDPFGSESPDQSDFYSEADVFEIFIKPGGQASYFEFHVSPRNQRFSIRLPEEGAIRRDKLPLSAYYWSLEPLRSYVRILPGHGWQALVGLQLGPLIESDAAGGAWQLSCCRYDYTRGYPAPVLSSTTAFSAVDFHRVQEWPHLTGMEAFLTDANQ